MKFDILTICYIVAAVIFIVGLKMLSSPATARRGNLVAAAGMFIAIVGTIFLYKDEDGLPLHNYEWIFAALIIGAIIGVVAAKKVKMTAMLEMVSFFNGMGGACSALISVIEFDYVFRAAEKMNSVHFSERVVPGHYLAIVAGSIIGSVSFAGSMVAWGKLNGSFKDVIFKAQHTINLLIFAGVIILAIITFFAVNAYAYYFFIATVILALIYGVLFVLPIGGADMPVVISLLNSFTGVAAACGGFLYNNKAMLTAGILVGAAGTLLTILISKAMKRSLTNVLIGSFGGNETSGGGNARTTGGTYKEISISYAAMGMRYANKEMIVPGYGLAVAQAQHTCHELENLLEEKGVEVGYAIHPVAGRMPGHMNASLAEADVSYDKLLKLEQANDALKTTDVVLVLGANDVVNPAAKNNPSSPIYGMPI
jgi:NAD(P) transhydrogenase subunit beta